jgi:hypothetical protein
MMVLGGGCLQVLGYKDATLDPSIAGAGGNGGSGTATASSTSGDGGAGGSASCVANSTAPCYSGPDGTKGMGPCKAGVKTCNAQGTAYGACAGEVVPVTEDCNSKGDEDCDGNACSDLLWANMLTSTTMGSTFPTVLAADTAGNVYVAGKYKETLIFEPGAAAISAATLYFIAKYDAAGKYLWHQDMQASSLSSLTFDAARNVYFAGSFRGTTLIAATGLSSNNASDYDAYVASFDPTGAPRWAKSFGGAGADNAVGVRIGKYLGEEVVVVAGAFGGAFKFPGAMNTLTPISGTDTYVATLSANGGAHIWSRSFGDAAGQPAGAQVPVGIATDSGGNVLVLGTFDTSIDIGSGPLLSAGSDDIYLVKFSPLGSHLWSKTFGSPGTDVPTGIATDSSGAPIITGKVAGTVSFGGSNLMAKAPGDTFVAKLSNVGVHQWGKVFGNASADDGGQGIAVDTSDAIYLTGTSAGTIDFGGGPHVPVGLAMDVPNAYLAKFDSAGVHQWSKMFGGPSIQITSAVAAGTDVFLTFWNVGAVDLGSGALNSGMNDSIILAKFTH